MCLIIFIISIALCCIYVALTSETSSVNKEMSHNYLFNWFTSELHGTEFDHFLMHTSHGVVEVDAEKLFTLLYVMQRNNGELESWLTLHVANKFAQIQINKLQSLLHELQVYASLTALESNKKSVLEFITHLLHNKSSDYNRSNAEVESEQSINEVDKKCYDNEECQYNNGEENLRANRIQLAALRGARSEHEVHAPFDALAWLQYRYMLMTNTRNTSNEVIQSAVLDNTTSDNINAHSLQLAKCLQNQSSVFNRRFLYPEKRYKHIKSSYNFHLYNTEAEWKAYDAHVTDVVNKNTCNNYGSAETVHRVANDELHLSMPSFVIDSKYCWYDHNTRYVQPHHLLSTTRVNDIKTLLETTNNNKELKEKEMNRSNDKDKALMENDISTIFVSFASYRDVQCGPTLEHMMYTAKNIDRVYVGIAEQNLESDTSCISPALLHPIPCQSHQTLSLQVNEEQKVTESNKSRGNGDEDVSLTNVCNTASAIQFAKQTHKHLFNLSSDDESVINNTLHVHTFASSMCYFYDNIRIRRTSAINALGPIMGRYLAMLLYRGEDMALVLDSHNRFTPFWDSLVVKLYGKYNDDKALLSHYPEGWVDNKNFAFERTSTAYLCKCEFVSNLGFIKLNGIVTVNVASFEKNNKFNDPYVQLQSSAIDAHSNFRLPQPWVAGGFLFGNASFIRNVPFDPHLPYIFQGEEVLYSTRLWTHGYNIYSPERNICYHMYGRTNAPKIWQTALLWNTVERLSQRRLHFYLQSHDKNVSTPKLSDDITDDFVIIDVRRYGMGNERTITQWYAYAGVDPVNYKVDGRWCG